MADALTSIDSGTPLGSSNDVPISPRIQQMGSGWKDRVKTRLNDFKTSESGRHMTVDEEGRRKPKSAPLPEKKTPVVFQPPAEEISETEARRQAFILSSLATMADKREKDAAAAAETAAAATTAEALTEPPPTVDQLRQTIKDALEAERAKQKQPKPRLFRRGK
jgi:hypothetical protein